MTHSPTPTELLALKTAHAAEASKDASYDLVSTIVFALGSAQLLQSPETAAELSRLVQDRAQWRTRYYEESRTYWDAELPPGGECCADCNQPVESEPCAEHHPATVAARLVEENARLRARVAELEAERSTLVADRDAQIVAWLGKKAREYRSTRSREHAAQAEVLERMADKVRRGAVRPLEDPHDSPLHHTYRLGHDLPEVPHA
ncbi:hypothetical protein [Streptomyces sp. NPDC054849]